MMKQRLAALIGIMSFCLLCMPVRQAHHGQIVSFAAAECCEAVGSPGAQTDGLCARSKSLPDAFLPNTFGSSIQAHLGLRHSGFEWWGRLGLDLPRGGRYQTQRDTIKELNNAIGW